ncbi:MAG: hypothetical protein KGL59_12745 [Acidobacteriota bacterium]|nr:hypothetical protein [Acidobacteriota bacterium]
MAATGTTAGGVRTIHCDGCTVEASPEHLRQRIARLEWGSRFRPIHIGTLFLAPAPPAALEDFFYAPEGVPREPDALAFYEDLLAACGIAGAAEGREKALGAFQHQGFFLAEAVECPVEDGGELDSLILRLTPTILRRVRFSYRPKSVLVLSERLAGVASALRGAGSEAEVLLWEGAPVALAGAGDAAGRERFRTQLKQLLG